MKTAHIFTVLLIFFVAITTTAQQGFNYKAIIHDDKGNPLAKTSITVQFVIYGYNDDFGGPVPTYAESHTPRTDDNGIILLNIGEGSLLHVNLLGDFSSIHRTS
jgi:hypothetical protein